MEKFFSLSDSIKTKFRVYPILNFDEDFLGELFGVKKGSSNKVALSAFLFWETKKFFIEVLLEHSLDLDYRLLIDLEKLRASIFSLADF